MAGSTNYPIGSKMKVNPLVLFWCVLWAAFTLLRIQSVWIVMLITVILGFPLFRDRDRSTERINQLRAFIFLLPLWMGIFILFSWISSDFTWPELLTRSALITLRFISLLILMSWYLTQGQSGELIRAVRSLWSNTGFHWREVDDAFLFIDLILRFFPRFIREWNSLKRARLSVGLPVSGDRKTVINRTLNDLPGVFKRVYSQADTTAQMMMQRGYGRHFPRHVLHPIPWRFSDSLLFILIPLSLISLRVAGAL